MYRIGKFLRRFAEVERREHVPYPRRHAGRRYLRDRIFRHFYSRDIANSIAEHGKVVNFALLDETDRWSDEYFAADSPKRHRREMFFANRKQSWTAKAPGDPTPFSTKTGRRKAPATSSAKGKSGVKRVKGTAVGKKKKAALKRAAAAKKSAVKKKKTAATKPRARKTSKRKP
jgi:hypothetical protein